MKKLFLILTILLSSFQVQGQEENQLNEMITSSIDSFITNDKRFLVEHMRYSLNDTIRYYVCTDGLPDGFSYEGKQFITFFSLCNMDGLPNSLKNKLKKGMAMLSIILKIKNNQFVISVYEYVAKCPNKKNINLAACGWCVSTYEYSCEKKKWILVNIRKGGV